MIIARGGGTLQHRATAQSRGRVARWAASFCAVPGHERHRDDPLNWYRPSPGVLAGALAYGVLTGEPVAPKHAVLSVWVPEQTLTRHEGRPVGFCERNLTSACISEWTLATTQRRTSNA